MNLYFKKNYLVGICLIFLSFPTYSAEWLYTAADLKLGYGSQASSDGSTLKSRSLLSYSAEASLGIIYTSFIFGVTGEYSFWRQITKPSTISNSNTQGTLGAAYPMIGINYAPFRLIVKFPSLIAGSYTLEKTNAAGSAVAYKSADAIGVQIHYLTTPTSFWGVEYEKLTFKKVTQATVETTLGTSSQFVQSSVSLLYGYTF